MLTQNSGQPPTDVPLLPPSAVVLHTQLSTLFNGLISDFSSFTCPEVPSSSPPLILLSPSFGENMTKEPAVRPTTSPSQNLLQVNRSLIVDLHFCESVMSWRHGECLTDF